MRKWSNRHFFITIVVVLFFTTDSIFAQSYRDRPEVTFGPKLGYTFGPNGGFTWGIEITYFPQIESFARNVRYGITFDYTAWGKDNVSFHLGAQLLRDDFVGIDIGPSLIIDSGKTNWGASGIIFAGLFIYPYFEVLVGRNTYPSFGAYAKFILRGKLPHF